MYRTVLTGLFRAASSISRRSWNYVTSSVVKYDGSARAGRVSLCARPGWRHGPTGGCFAVSEGMTDQRLRLVIFQDEPGLWLARGLEHDLAAEGSTIGQAIRAVARIV